MSKTSDHTALFFQFLNKLHTPEPELFMCDCGYEVEPEDVRFCTVREKKVCDNCFNEYHDLANQELIQDMTYNSQTGVWE